MKPYLTNEEKIDKLQKELKETKEKLQQLIEVFEKHRDDNHADKKTILVGRIITASSDKL